MLLKFLAFFGAAMGSLRMFSSLQELIHKEHFGLSKSEAGYVMSALSVIEVFSKMLLVGVVTEKLGGIKALQASLYGLFCSFAFFVLYPNSVIFYLGGVCLLRTLSASLFTTISKGVLTSFVDTNKIGLVISMLHAAWAVAGVFGPLLGTALYTRGGIRLLGSVISCLLLCASLVAPSLQQGFQIKKRN